MYQNKPKLHERQKAHQPGHLRTVALDVTGQCNLHCPHCYAETFRDAEPVDLKVLGRAFDQLDELGVYHYVLQGGEPLTDLPRLKSILRMIHTEQCYVNVVTNGWLLTPDILQELKELGVDKIAFSLDSGLEAEHDYRRGEGSFHKVIQGMKMVKNADLLASFSIVVTHQSINSVGFFQAYALAEQMQVRMDMQIAEPVGKWDGNTDVLVDEKDAARLKLLELGSPILPNGQRMVSRDIYSGPDDHCPAGTEFIAITVTGEVMPCNFLQFTAGNIREHSIMELREKILGCPWFDGKHPSCLCGENAEFIQNNLVPHKDKAKPLLLEDIQ